MDFSALLLIGFGVYMSLIAYRVLPKNPKNPEEFEEWYKKFGKMLKIISPLVVIFGVLKLFNVL